MNKNDFSDLMKSIDILYNNKSDVKQDNFNNYNPISELITPEWHYSDSDRIFSNGPIRWNSLGEYDIVTSIANDIKNTEIPDDIVGSNFEISFCSWYQPYHFLPRTKWGIHIRKGSWMRISSLFYRRCPSTINKIIDSTKAAFLYLFTHELFHHIIENASSILELVLEKPDIYTKYFTDVYSQTFNLSDCLEEALCNSYLFRWSSQCHINDDFLRGELLKQGPGYNNFINYVNSKFNEGKRQILSQIKSDSLNSSIIYPIEQIIDDSDPMNHLQINNVPIWLHSNAKPLH